MILEALNAEKLFANGILAIPRRRKTRALKGAPREELQLHLSAARSCAEDDPSGSHPIAAGIFYSFRADAIPERSNGLRSAFISLLRRVPTQKAQAFVPVVSLQSTANNLARLPFS